MKRLGHYYEGEGSKFRIFAPQRKKLELVLSEGKRIKLSKDRLGYWEGECERLSEGTLYKVEVNGRPYPDPASKYQPKGVHGHSMVVAPKKADLTGWKGIRIEESIIYELHLGTFSREGTLAGAEKKLPYLRDLGINVIELMPINAFPGKRNWGYDGAYHFALHESYGTYEDLKSFIEKSHSQGIAVILDVVYNHFGPEGNYSGVYANYTKDAPTPWGAAINFDGSYNYGIREFYLENTRYWLEDIGFDGFRMDAVSLIFDNMPVHILREITDLVREVSIREGREIINIAEHLRNDRYVTNDRGFNYDSQWNDDVNYAIFAKLTGENKRHYGNFGTFEDVVKGMREGFVLDGTRFDTYCKYFMGSDGRDTEGAEHVVHIQNHDQLGNRLMGDRMIATYGRDKALLGIAAVLATPYVPMLFQGEEYGETAPFLFFEDFGDQRLIDAVRAGRKREYGFGDMEPEDPHAVETFERSKLIWETLKSKEGKDILDYYKKLLSLKKSGKLGPVDRSLVQVKEDREREIIYLETPHTLTVLNFSDKNHAVEAAGSIEVTSEILYEKGRISPYGAQVYKK